MDNLLEPMSESDVAAADLVARAMNADEGRWADRTMWFHFGCRRYSLDDGRLYYVWKQDGAVAGLVSLHHVIRGRSGTSGSPGLRPIRIAGGRDSGASLLTAVEKIAVGKG